MQTSIIVNTRLALTTETANSVGLSDSAAVRLVPFPKRNHVLAEPATEPATKRVKLRRLGSMHLLHLPPKLMEMVGWENGDVVDMEEHDGKLLIRRLDDPSSPSLTTAGDDGGPVPPHWLVQTVSGTVYTKSWVESGRETADHFSRLIKRHLPEVERPAILDFGCGCGRVARALPDYVTSNLCGCDITRAAVQWCRQNLSGEYFSSSENPPLPVADEQFDVLYAISVMTHFDEAHQDAWLAEWRRIVKPGGLLLVTYRSEDYLASRASIRSAQREKIEPMCESNGFAFVESDHLDGVFPTFYGQTFHTHAYVRERWGQFFDVIELRPPGEGSWDQDLAVLRRKA
jgi:SAM-dependent methyltransferase